MKSTFSVGFATAHDPNGRTSTERMFSLKLN
jgi:hypothetical protein